MVSSSALSLSGESRRSSWQPPSTLIICLLLSFISCSQISEAWALSATSLRPGQTAYTRHRLTASKTPIFDELRGGRDSLRVDIRRETHLRSTWTVCTAQPTSDTQNRSRLGKGSVGLRQNRRTGVGIGGRDGGGAFLRALEAAALMDDSSTHPVPDDRSRWWSSWQERFASLRNDAKDPWTRIDYSTASSAVDTEPSSSSTTPSPYEDRINVEDGRDGEGESQGERPFVASVWKSSPTATLKGSTPANIAKRDDRDNDEVGPANNNDDQDDDGDHHSSFIEATELIESRGESDAAAALRGYHALLDAAAMSDGRESDATSQASSGMSSSSSRPSDALLVQRTAEALLSWIRCETAGNGLVIANDGQVATADTAERRELWAEHAPKVLELLKKTGKDTTLDAQLQHTYTEAIMYSVSSQGIVEAFVSGKALAFTSAMGVLVKKFPTQDNGVAFIFQGSYYLAAPWPIRSPKKARENYDKALKINPRSRRNTYYAGLGRLACGDRQSAAEMFRRALSDELCESSSPTERDIATPLREQSRRGLSFCENSTTYV